MARSDLKERKIKRMNKDKLKEYFYSNIATIFWSSFLLIGGGIFLAYYAHIEYMQINSDCKKLHLFDLHLFYSRLFATLSVFGGRL